MSWSEYNDMWDTSQTNGKYHLFCFDLKESKKAGYFYPQVRKLLYRTYFKIMDIENETGKQILHKSDIFNKGDRGDLLEPFFFSGDFFGFTIIRDSLTREQVYEIVRKSKEELEFQYQIHYADGFYETDEYQSGNELYFRGYCMQYLDDIMKRKAELI